MLAQWRPAPVRPVLDYPIGDLGHAEQMEAEAKQPFRVHVVDDGVRDLLRVSERLRCSPVAQLAHHSLHHGVKIHAIQGSSPFLGDIALDLKKLPLRPAFEGFRLRALPEDESLLVAQLDGRATGEHDAAVNCAEVELAA